MEVARFHVMVHEYHSTYTFYTSMRTSLNFTGSATLTHLIIYYLELSLINEHSSAVSCPGLDARMYSSAIYLQFNSSRTQARRIYCCQSNSLTGSPKPSLISSPIYRQTILPSCAISNPHYLCNLF